VSLKRRRHLKHRHCGFCGCEITAKEEKACGKCCWICHRNREDRAAVNKDEENND
jgi:hypothetical protein